MIDRSAKPMRADARRNFDAIVAAARAAFAAEGAQASLDDIAVRAGVGNATLYRHFPTRDFLIVETMRDELESLERTARSLAAQADAGAALEQWFFEVATLLHAWPGLPNTVVDALRTETSPMRTAWAPLQLRTQMLLMKAQSVGAAREDLTAEEAFALIATISWAADRFSDSDSELRRRIDISLSGVRLR